jgi:hypothetical protein
MSGAVLHQPVTLEELRGAAAILRRLCHEGSESWLRQALDGLHAEIGRREGRTCDQCGKRDPRIFGPDGGVWCNYPCLGAWIDAKHARDRAS